MIPDLGNDLPIRGFGEYRSDPQTRPRTGIVTRMRPGRAMADLRCDLSRSNARATQRCDAAMPRAVQTQAPDTQLPAGVRDPLPQTIHFGQKRRFRLRRPLMQVVEEELEAAACILAPEDEADRAHVG